jgi:hypothetical protein
MLQPKLSVLKKIARSFFIGYRDIEIACLQVVSGLVESFSFLPSIWVEPTPTRYCLSQFDKCRKLQQLCKACLLRMNGRFVQPGFVNRLLWPQQTEDQ